MISLLAPSSLRSIVRLILRVLNNLPLMYGSGHFFANRESFLVSSTPKVLVLQQNM